MAELSGCKLYLRMCRLLRSILTPSGTDQPPMLWDHIKGQSYSMPEAQLPLLCSACILVHGTDVGQDICRYGSLAEIGAGQEVARWFFRVGGAAGTIAKSVSA